MAYGAFESHRDSYSRLCNCEAMFAILDIHICPEIRPYICTYMTIDIEAPEGSDIVNMSFWMFSKVQIHPTNRAKSWSIIDTLDSASFLMPGSRTWSLID